MITSIHSFAKDPHVLFQSALQDRMTKGNFKVFFFPHLINSFLDGIVATVTYGRSSVFCACARSETTA